MQSSAVAAATVSFLHVASPSLLLLVDFAVPLSTNKSGFFSVGSSSTVISPFHPPLTGASIILSCLSYLFFLSLPFLSIPLAPFHVSLILFPPSSVSLFQLLSLQSFCCCFCLTSVYPLSFSFVFLFFRSSFLISLVNQQRNYFPTNFYYLYFLSLFLSCPFICSILCQLRDSR